MDYNLSVWGYYPKNDKFFVDPMYVPYMKNNVQEGDQVCQVNPWKKQGYSDGLVNPALVRKGWGRSFQLMYPEKDPCPLGWSKHKDGWCVVDEPEFGDHGIYSKDAFVPKYQYWKSYAPQLSSPRYKEINAFDMKTVSPWTGKYVIYHNPTPASNREKYGYLPSKDSYLA